MLFVYSVNTVQYSVGLRNHRVSDFYEFWWKLGETGRPVCSNVPSLGKM